MASVSKEENMAHAVTMVAKLRADPVIIKFNKLLEFAQTKGFDIKPIEGEFRLILAGEPDKVLFTCEKLDELNEWFIAVFGTHPLIRL